MERCECCPAATVHTRRDELVEPAAVGWRNPVGSSLTALPLVSMEPTVARSRFGTIMQEKHLESMSVDELWTLYEQVDAKLAELLIAKKEMLENRLKELSRPFQAKPYRTGRRTHPKQSRKPGEPFKP
jgi:hypothetical protein